MTAILVVDDRPSDRDLLSTVLSYAGYEVIEAANGIEALEVAKGARPDLVITDLLMPGMNGYELVRHLRTDAATAEMGAIFCTATYAEAEIHRLAEACGVSHVITKPCEPAELIAAVRDVLASSATLPRLSPEDFDREQLRVLNEKLVQKVNELEVLNYERRRLAVELIHAHAGERERIAMALHDDPIQALAGVSMRLELLARELSGPDPEALVRLRGETWEAMERLRTLVFELQPPALKGEGLAAALREYLEQVGPDSRLEWSVDDGTAEPPDEITSELLYSLAREALANVRKHAQASRVDVELFQPPGEVAVRVTDDGRGFDPAAAMQVHPGHLGLPSVRERVELAGGSLRIESGPGEGAVIEIRVPARIAVDPGGSPR